MLRIKFCSSGRVSEEVYDAMLLNADCFCDEDECDENTITGGKVVFEISDYVEQKETKELMLIVDIDESGCSVKDRNGSIIKVKTEDLKVVEADYVIPVTWEMYGEIKIYAKNAQDALERAEENLDHIKLPCDGKYVDASLEITDRNINYLHLYQHFGN